MRALNSAGMKLLVMFWAYGESLTITSRFAAPQSTTDSRPRDTPYRHTDQGHARVVKSGGNGRNVTVVSPCLPPHRIWFPTASTCYMNHEPLCGSTDPAGSFRSSPVDRSSSVWNRVDDSAVVGS